MIEGLAGKAAGQRHHCLVVVDIHCCHLRAGRGQGG